MRRADAIVAVSRFCAHEAVDRLDLDPGLVHVVHHGVDERFRGTDTDESSEIPYLLFVGEFGPTKGHEDAYTLIAAMARRGLPHRLKVVGRIVPWYRDQIESQVGRSPRPDLIDLMGYVGDALPELYRRASALVVTSRYESFCLPALEAMASGTPVVAYSNTALPEIIGTAGRLVSDGDVRAFAEATSAVLTDASLAQELRLRGRDRSSRFSWRKCASRHAEIFTELAR